MAAEEQHGSIKHGSGGVHRVAPGGYGRQTLVAVVVAQTAERPHQLPGVPVRMHIQCLSGKKYKLFTQFLKEIPV